VTAGLALLAVLCIVAWFVWPGGEREPGAADREVPDRADAKPLFSGPAFSGQATVADIKQLSVGTAEELAAAYPASADAWNVLAHLRFHLGNTPEAVDLWQKCLAADPKLGDAHYGLGYISYLEGDNVKAAERFRAALSINPGDQRIPLLLAETLTRQGKPEEAVPLLVEHLKGNQASMAALLALGRVYADLGEHEKARAVFERAMQVDPKNREALFGLGTAWARLGNAERSKQAMSAFRGLAANERKQSAARVTGFDDMAKAREVAVLIHNEAAKAYDGHGDLEKAEVTWCMAAALDPKDARSRKELAALYERIHRDRSALRVCEELRDLEPANADYWLNVGVLNGRLSRYDAARAAIEQAVKLDPSNPKYRQAYDLIRSTR
jgi:tetratricopeptide (TPR) repeat protein